MFNEDSNESLSPIILNSCSSSSIESEKVLLNQEFVSNNDNSSSQLTVMTFNNILIENGSIDSRDYAPIQFRDDCGNNNIDFEFVNKNDNSFAQLINQCLYNSLWLQYCSMCGKGVKEKCNKESDIAKENGKRSTIQGFECVQCKKVFHWECIEEDAKEFIKLNKMGSANNGWTCISCIADRGLSPIISRLLSIWNNSMAITIRKKHGLFTLLQNPLYNKVVKMLSNDDSTPIQCKVLYTGLPSPLYNFDAMFKGNLLCPCHVSILVPADVNIEYDILENYSFFFTIKKWYYAIRAPDDSNFMEVPQSFLKTLCPAYLRRERLSDSNTIFRKSIVDDHRDISLPLPALPAQIFLKKVIYKNRKDEKIEKDSRRIILNIAKTATLSIQIQQNTKNSLLKTSKNSMSSTNTTAVSTPLVPAVAKPQTSNNVPTSAKKESQPKKNSTAPKMVPVAQKPLLKEPKPIVVEEVVDDEIYEDEVILEESMPMPSLKKHNPPPKPEQPPVQKKVPAVVSTAKKTQTQQKPQQQQQAPVAQSKVSQPKKKEVPNNTQAARKLPEKEEESADEIYEGEEDEEEKEEVEEEEEEEKGDEIDENEYEEVLEEEEGEGEEEDMPMIQQPPAKKPKLSTPVLDRSKIFVADEAEEDERDDQDIDEEHEPEDEGDGDDVLSESDPRMDQDDPDLVVDDNTIQYMDSDEEEGEKFEKKPTKKKAPLPKTKKTANDIDMDFEEVNIDSAEKLGKESGKKAATPTAPKTKKTSPKSKDKASKGVKDKTLDSATTTTSRKRKAPAQETEKKGKPLADTDKKKEIYAYLRKCFAHKATQRIQDISAGKEIPPDVDPLQKGVLSDADYKQKIQKLLIYCTLFTPDEIRRNMRKDNSVAFNNLYKDDTGTTKSALSSQEMVDFMRIIYLYLPKYATTLPHHTIVSSVVPETKEITDF